MSFLSRALLPLLFRRAPRLNFRPLSPTARLPVYATDGAAGMDLFADEFVTVAPNTRRLVKTNVAIDLPDDYEAQVRPRSGLALKRGLTVLNSPGTIDPDYIGGIGVILFNTGNDHFSVFPGDRIAQLVIAPFHRVTPTWAKEIADAQEARQTARGADGFGSTGTGEIAASEPPVAAKAPSWIEGDPALMGRV